MDNDDAHLDFETYCDLDIRKVGGYRYARHPSCEVLLARYLLPGQDGYPREWRPRTQRPPAELVNYVRRGGKIAAHNAPFERLIWRYVLRRMHPTVPPVLDKQWVCTAAMAAASGLPRSLEGALRALGMGVEKDAEGAKLIKVFCSPRKPTKKDPRTRIYPEDDPCRFDRFSEYCAHDVLGEKAVHAALPELTPRERTMFLLDMRMNDRGLPIDLPMVRSALTVVRGLEEDVKARVAAITGGVTATQVAKLMGVLSDMGVDLENMRAETVRQFVQSADTGSVSPEALELLHLRIEAGKASTKKLVSMLACADPDDWVVQGGFLYHGAHTGRYTGRLVQPQNFIRGNLKEKARDRVFRLLAKADWLLLALLFDRPIDTISQCMRGFICAPDGYELAVVDYTAIEARILAWVAGEQHMLDAYFQGVDVYKLMAKKLWKLASLDDVSDEQRRIAKNLVLGCGYSLGGARFVDYCANAGLIIEADFAMSAVRAYRREHPAIVESWTTVERLVVSAIKSPGTVFRGLRCAFYMREHWLCIQLPSGREIRYPRARAVPTERWGKPAHAISFMTDFHGKPVRESTYGGKLIENIVQGIARDVMMEGMLSAEDGGYPPIGTVHDELLALRERGTTDVKALERLVCELPRWTAGMPLAAKGFVTVRYRKD